MKIVVTSNHSRGFFV